MKLQRKKRRWRLLTLIVVVVVAAGAGYAFYGRTEETIPITVPVTRGNVEITVLASGSVEAENLVSVGAQVSGQLKSLKVDLGDTVKAGDLVAEIDSLTQQNTLRNSEAALAASQAQLKSKEASLHLAELVYERQKKMMQGDAASLEDYQSAEADLEVAKAEIVELKAEIEQSKISVDTAKLDVGYTKITSPIDGMVVAIVTKEGQTVNANQSAPTIIKVAKLDRMIIKVEISEADVVRVKPGQKVYYTILGEPEKRYPATLESIEPAPESISDDDSSSSSSSSDDEAIYYMGVLNVPNDEGKLRISMTAQVNIVLDEAEHALVVPSAALGAESGPGRYTVQVETAPGKVEPRQVQVGLNDNVKAEVLDGLQEGDMVGIGMQDGAAPVADSDSNGGGRRMHGPPPGMM